MFASSSQEKEAVYKKGNVMAKKIMCGILLSIMIAAPLSSAEHNAGKKQITDFRVLVEDVKKQQEAHRSQQAKLEISTRKGPRLDGNPDQKKPGEKK